MTNEQVKQMLVDMREGLSEVIQNNVFDMKKSYYRAILRASAEIDLAISFIENPEREELMNKKIWGEKK